MSNYNISHRGFYSVSLVSLALLLVLCGFFLTGWFFSDHFTRKFNEDIRIVAELEENAGQSEAEPVIQALKAHEDVLPESVAFVSRDAALEEMRAKLGDDIVLENMTNPFRNMIEFSVRGERFNRAVVDDISSDIALNSMVADVHQPRDFHEDVFSLVKRLRFYALLILIGALVVSGVLIHHIMRLNILAQEERIRTMELVGADLAFIRRPFMRSGRQMAIEAWIIAVVLSVGMWVAILGPANSLEWIASIPALISTVALLVIGFGVCILSTRIALSKSTGSTFLRAN